MFLINIQSDEIYENMKKNDLYSEKHRYTCNRNFEWIEYNMFWQEVHVG